MRATNMCSNFGGSGGFRCSPPLKLDKKNGVVVVSVLKSLVIIL